MVQATALEESKQWEKTQVINHTAFAEPMIHEPMTKIEGHLRINTAIEDGKVINAWSSAQLYRGVGQVIVNGNNSFSRRFCGVCTTSRKLANIRAIENALHISIPEIARLLRNILLSILIANDHLTHFYQMHCLDWSDIAEALKASPQATAEIASDLCVTEFCAEEFTSSQKRLNNFISSGQLTLLSNAAFSGGHPAYKLTPEENLIIASNALKWINVQQQIHKALSLLSAQDGSSPVVVGGMNCPDALTSETITQIKAIWKHCSTFINTNYAGDIKIIARRYPEAAEYGHTTNFLDFNEFAEPESVEKFFFKGGILFDNSLTQVKQLNMSDIEQYAVQTWDEEDFDEVESYSWQISPRYQGRAMETGPLARRAMAYAKGDKETHALFGIFLSEASLKPEKMFSTLGRTVARCVETMQLADKTRGWLKQLEDRCSADKILCSSWNMSANAEGVGFASSARGGMNQWVRIENGNLNIFQMPVPSTWNMGSRGQNGSLSPVEEALTGTDVQDAKRPIEIMRTIHSFDPSIACSVQTISPENPAGKIFRIL